MPLEKIYDTFLSYNILNNKTVDQIGQWLEIECFSCLVNLSITLRNHAWINHYNIVSATGNGAQVIDMTGDVVASDGEFARRVCVPLNLEKEFLHLWPHTLRLKDNQKKYGREIRLKIYHPENWATPESLDAGIKVNDIPKEYEIPAYDAQIRKQPGYKVNIAYNNTIFSDFREMITLHQHDQIT